MKIKFTVRGLNRAFSQVTYEIVSESIGWTSSLASFSLTHDIFPSKLDNFLVWIFLFFSLGGNHWKRTLVTVGDFQKWVLIAFNDSSIKSVYTYELRFGGTYCTRLQCRRISQAIIQRQAGSKSRRTLPWKRRRYVLPMSVEFQRATQRYIP